MGHNPKLRCLDCRSPTGKGPRVMRCDPCNVIAAKARVERYRIVRECARCDRPAAYRRPLCAKCQVGADRERRARSAAATKRWRAANYEKARAIQERAYRKNHAKHTARQRAYDHGRKAQNASKMRRWKAKTQPWSPARMAKLRSQIQAAIWSTLPPDIRDDVASSMVLAVLEGKLDQNDIAAKARSFMSAELRRFNDLSLDDFIPGTTVRRIDALESNGENRW